MDYFAGAPLGSLVFERTYSRMKQDGTKETWPEVVERVVRGNTELVDPQFIEPGEVGALTDLMTRRVLLPAGRHLWVTGTGSRFSNNCWRAGWSTGLAGHCSFVFDQLMTGGGVGANYSSSYLKTLKPILGRVVPRFVCRPDHPDYASFEHLLNNFAPDDPKLIHELKVADSREGWVQALEYLIRLAEHSSMTLVIDVSNIRPDGSPIRGFGGTAAGPKPLMDMLIAASKILFDHLGERISPLGAMELDHAIASCVVAGNVRRSARMSIMHWKDPFIWAFLQCKNNGDKHWSTNISVEVDDEFFQALYGQEPIGRVYAEKVLDTIIDGMLRDGEPGIFNSSLASRGERGDVRSTNPCGEIALEEWEPCCLGHVNLAGTDETNILEAFRLMTRFLVRATFTGSHDPKSREVVDRNRRIGVGFLGLQEWMAKNQWSFSDYDAERLSTSMNYWRKMTRWEATSYAKALGINAPIKTTAVAPTGTISKLAGTTEGLHSALYKHYIRRVRFASNDPQLQQFLPEQIEPCVYTENTSVVSIPCEDPMIERLGRDAQYIEEAQDIPLEKLLALQALIQKHYADNAVSHTINIENVTNETREELRRGLINQLPHLKGVTVFPSASRAQQPIERITEDQYLMYKASSTMELSDEELNCATGACPIR